MPKMLAHNGGLPSGNYPDRDLVEYVRADVAKREAAAALDAKDAEIATLRQALGGADTAMRLAEGVIVSKRELFALAQARASARAALFATTKE